jgi:PIN domain nuclease of toxin-antitoxin system
MKLLLDTHVLVWWLVNSPRLSKKARDAISEPGNAIFVSAASAWEIATKVRLGKWPEAAALVGAFGAIVASNGFDPLPVSVQHAVHAGSLRATHPDPFDRMLAAQAELEDLELVTVDPAFVQFNVRAIW